MSEHFKADTYCFQITSSDIDVICSSPKTCIRNVKVDCQSRTPTFPNAAAIGELQYIHSDRDELANFLRTNDNIETIKMEKVGWCDEELQLWRAWLPAAFQNNSVRHLDLELCFSETPDWEEMISILRAAAPSKLRKLDIHMESACDIQHVEKELIDVIASHSSIEELELSRFPESFLFTLMSTMSKKEFSCLKKLKIRLWGQTCPDCGLSNFLKSTGASSLKELDLNWGPPSAASMKTFLDAVAQNTSIKVLRLQHEGLAEAAAQHLSSYILEQSELDELAITRTPLTHIFEALTSTTKVGKLHIDDKQYHRRDVPSLCWPSSLQSLEMLVGFQFHPDGLVSKIMDPIVACTNLKSLRITLEGSLHPICMVDAPFDIDIRYFLDELIAPTGNRVALTKLKIEINEGLITEESVTALSNILHKPNCRLEELEVKAELDDHHILSLVSGAQKRSSMKHLKISSSKTASLDTWLSICASLPKLQLKAIELSLRVDWRRTAEVSARVPKELYKGLKLNTHTEKAKFEWFKQPKEWLAALEKICVRNKAANAARALRDGKLPMTLAPVVLKAVQKICKYCPGKDQSEALLRTLLFEILRNKPCKEMVDAVKVHLANSRTQPEARIDSEGRNGRISNTLPDRRTSTLESLPSGVPKKMKGVIRTSRCHQP